MQRALSILAALVFMMTMFVGSTTLAVTETATPTDDAFVKQSDPNGNTGSQNFLRTEGLGMHAYLKFTVPTAELQNPTLILTTDFANSSHLVNPTDVEVFVVTDDGWNETTLTWNNRPLPSDNVEEGTAAYTGQSVLEIQLANIQGDGELTLLLVSDGYRFRSSETSDAPELAFDTTTASSATPEPTTEPTAEPTAEPTTTPAPTPSPTATTPPTGDPRVTCEGYPEPRVFLESQDWWEPIPELGGLGHVHMGMCFPLGQTVSGTVDFDVRVMLHENKGTLIRIKMQDDSSTNGFLLKPDITPPTGGLHTYWFEVSIDTTEMDDGLRQFRWYADLLHANDNTQTARASWPLDVENGTTDNNVSGGAADVRFMNWYQVANPERDWGYAGPVIDPVPLAPVSGNFVVNVHCAVNGDANSPEMDRRIVNMDPSFHSGLEGTVVHDSATTSGNITIDTTQFANGRHSLVARCIQIDGEERHEGIGVIQLVIDN